eukprot:GHVU01051344.1.p1 GENE.GHVU01051344.1~~GHVU01051344.1.p1  ORF type:complete len:732 (+),score=185.52 GHVU01051344.1:2-2197(+)
MLKGSPKIKTIGDQPDAARQRADYKELTTTPFPKDNLISVFDLAQRSVRMYRDRPCLGTRSYLGTQKADPKKGQRFDPELFAPEVQWVTYGEFGDRLQAFGAGLKKLGMVSQPDNVDKFEEVADKKVPCSLTIYENTCASWQTAAHACFSQSMVVTTVYATLGEMAVVDAVNELHSNTLLCNRKAVENLAKLRSKMPSLKNIIYTDEKIAPKDRVNKPVASGVDVYSFEEVIELGQRNPTEFTPPKAKSMAVVMYTSGSTGKPKGVMIRHGAMLAEVAGVVHHFSPVIIPGQEVFAAFLPLAHILALVAEQSQLAVGAAIGYCDPRTLTNSGSEPVGALAAFKPTIMAAVPKIWDVIKKGAEAKAKAGGGAKHYIFQTAVSTKIAMRKLGMDTPLFNALVFKKIGEITGGRLKIAISGGGPLDKQVQEFCSAAICPIIQGYGLTETLGGNCIQPIGDTRPSIVGIPLSSVKVRLIDARTEDGTDYVTDTHGKPYKADDKVNASGQPCGGRGEVLIGGNTLSEGYFKMAKETNEAYITKDGERWFATGDVGEWTPDGCLKIVDRKKNLVKLLGGEYVPVEHMECKYANSLYVDALAGGMMVYADGTMDRSVAFVQANKKELLAWAESKKLTTEWPALLQTPEARAFVWNDLIKTGKEGGLGDLETLFNVTLLDGSMGDGPDAWTPANGGLTATNKIQRKAAVKLIQEKYGMPVWTGALKDNRKALKDALAKI